LSCEPATHRSVPVTRTSGAGTPSNLCGPPCPVPRTFGLSYEAPARIPR
jgi:hypothetical protein